MIVSGADNPTLWRRVAAGGRWLRETLAFYLLYAVFAIGCFGFGLGCFLLAVVLPARIGAPLGQRMIGCWFRLYLGMLRRAGLLRADLGALDRLRAERGLVIAANHPSLLDVVLLLSRLPATVCIAKPAIWNNPLLGGGARLAGYLPNNSPLRLVRQARAALAAGRLLLIFPEGTRTQSFPVNRFKPGFALIAGQARAPVQTVFIDAATPFLGKQWKLLHRPALPLVYRVRLGRRFMVSEDPVAFSDRLERYFREEMTGGARYGER